jgi:hypothetical protein
MLRGSISQWTTNEEVDRFKTFAKIMKKFGISARGVETIQVLRCLGDRIETK